MLYFKRIFKNKRWCMLCDRKSHCKGDAYLYIRKGVIKIFRLYLNFRFVYAFATEVQSITVARNNHRYRFPVWNTTFYCVVTPRIFTTPSRPYNLTAKAHSKSRWSRSEEKCFALRKLATRPSLPQNGKVDKIHYCYRPSMNRKYTNGG